MKVWHFAATLPGIRPCTIGRCVFAVMPVLCDEIATKQLPSASLSQYTPAHRGVCISVGESINHRIGAVICRNEIRDANLTRLHLRCDSSRDDSARDFFVRLLSSDKRTTDGPVCSQSITRFFPRCELFTRPSGHAFTPIHDITPPTYGKPDIYGNHQNKANLNSI